MPKGKYYPYPKKGRLAAAKKRRKLKAKAKKT